MSKKKKIILFSVLGVCFLIVIGICVAYFVVFNHKEEPPIVESVVFKDVSEISYNDFSLEDLVLGVTCEEKCSFNDEEIEYSISEINALGLQQVIVSVTYQGEKYEKTYEIQVVDTKAPEIVLSLTEVTISKGEEFIPNSYITNVNDNYDELTYENVQIDNPANVSEVGDYEVIYTLKDSSENVSSVKLMVHVVEGEAANTNSSQSTNSSSGSNNSGSSSSSSNNSSQGSSGATGSSTLKNAINQVSLSPMKTRHTALDNQIASILSSTTNSSMSNYDKLRAIYDYVKQKLSYEIMITNINELWNLQDQYGYYSFDGLLILEANYSLQTGYGSCDNYSALFMILARRLGFEAYVVNGQYTNTQNETMGHAWVMIKAGGAYYIFDPQIEDNYGYNYFGLATNQVKAYTYNLSSSINNFHSFGIDSSLGRKYTLNMNITGAYTDSDSFDSDIHSYNYTSVFQGESITIELVANINQKYTVEVLSNNVTVSKEEFTGDRKVITYTFDEVGEDTLEIRFSNSRMSITYDLIATVKEKEN